jgi:DNA-binding FrmR family transcriptional regulator
MQVDEYARSDVLRRLHRAEGQLRGVMAMVETGRDCLEVLTQLIAVSHAVNGAGFVILAGGLQQCVDARQAGEDQSATVARLEKLFLSLS